MSTSGGVSGITSPLTTKGDVWGFSTASARIPVGSDGQVLTADSTQALGVKWAAAAAGSVINPVQAGALVNATSPGDAGSRADHFTGSSLGGAWTVAGAALSSSNVANSIYGPVAGTNFTIITRPYTPTGAFDVHACVHRGAVTSSQLWLLCGDSSFTVNASSVFSGNAAFIQFSDSSGSNGPSKIQAFSCDAGTLTGHTAITLTGSSGFETYYLRVSRDGSNNWTMYGSIDRCTWVALNAFAKTFTVAVVGFCVLNTSPGYSGIDFFDVAA